MSYVLHYVISNNALCIVCYITKSYMLYMLYVICYKLHVFNVQCVVCCVLLSLLCAVAHAAPGLAVYQRVLLFEWLYVFAVFRLLYTTHTLRAG
jgi:hypothetical protein